MTIFSSAAAMYRHNKNNPTPPYTGACFAPKKDKPKDGGEIHLHSGDISAGTIAHEVLHALVNYWQMRAGSEKVVMENADEEHWFCNLLGEITGEIYRKAWRKVRAGTL